MTSEIESVPVNQPDALIGPLLVWLAIQLAALALVCFRIPLWAKFPQPPDLLAASTMLVVQCIVAALLLPLLFRRIKSSLAIAATSWPMLLAAGAIASAPTYGLLLAGTYETALFTVLCLWGKVLKTRSAAMSGAAVASALVVGPAVLEYLRLEFNPGATRAAALWRVTPIPASINALSGSIDLSAWTFLGVIALPPIVQMIFSRRRAI